MFTYGILIYRLLGQNAENAFVNDWGVGLAADLVSQWRDVLRETLLMIALLFVLDALISTERWFEMHLDALSGAPRASSSAKTCCIQSSGGAGRAQPPRRETDFCMNPAVGVGPAQHQLKANITACRSPLGAQFKLRRSELTRCRHCESGSGCTLHTRTASRWIDCSSLDLLKLPLTVDRNQSVAFRSCLRNRDIFCE